MPTVSLTTWPRGTFRSDVTAGKLSDTHKGDTHKGDIRIRGSAHKDRMGRNAFPWSHLFQPGMHAVCPLDLGVCAKSSAQSRRVEAPK